MLWQRSLKENGNQIQRNGPAIKVKIKTLHQAVNIGPYLNLIRVFVNACRPLVPGR